MKWKQNLSSVLILLSTSLAWAEEPRLQAVDSNQDGWMEWIKSDAPENVFMAPGPIVAELAKNRSIEWIQQQATNYPGSAALQAVWARKLWEQGQRDESLRIWDRATRLNTDVLLESAFHYYQDKQWGRAFEQLAQAGPMWPSLNSGALRKNPLLARLLDAGWLVDGSGASLSRDGIRVELSDLGAKAYEPVLLGSESAIFQNDTGSIGLDSVNLLLTVSPAKDGVIVASVMSGSQGVTEEFGKSVEGRPIEVQWLGDGPETVVFFGAFHGDEPESTDLLNKFVTHLRSHPELLEGRTAVIVPIVNPDGLNRGQRRNANEVDLNRNYPTSNWNSDGKGTDYWGGTKPVSEPETQVVIDVLDRFKPARIISVHCPYRCVNYDGPAEELAKALSAENGYKVEPSIGYPTPGSFGTYAGIEAKIPTITLELPPTGEEDVWKGNKSALVRALRGVTNTD